MAHIKRCNKIFEKNSTKILEHNKAFADLKQWNRMHMFVGVNNGVSKGLLPLTAVAFGAMLYKKPEIRPDVRNKVMIGVVCLCIATNAAAHYARGKIPELSDRLTTDYVIGQKEMTLRRYEGNPAFPYAN